MTTLIDWIKNQTDSIKRSLAKLVNRDFIEAISAGCALVAAADGVVRSSEKEKMRRYIEGSDILRNVEPDEIAAAFDKYVRRMEQDYLLGEAEAYMAIGMIRSNPSNARLLIRVCCAICVSDGMCHENEIEALRRIARDLHLDFEEVVGSVEDIAVRSEQSVSVEVAEPPPVPEAPAPPAEDRPPVDPIPAAPSVSEVPAGPLEEAHAPAADPTLAAPEVSDAPAPPPEEEDMAAEATDFIFAKTPDPKQHVVLDAGTGAVRYRCVDVAVTSAFSVMVNGIDGRNLFNINAGAKEGSAQVFDNRNQLSANVHRTSAIYRHYGIDDPEGVRKYDLIESSKPSAREWSLIEGTTEIGGVEQISGERARELLENRGSDPEEVKLDGAIRLRLGGVVEEAALFAIFGGIYMVMVAH